MESQQARWWITITEAAKSSSFHQPITPPRCPQHTGCTGRLTLHFQPRCRAAPHSSSWCSCFWRWSSHVWGPALPHAADGCTDCCRHAACVPRTSWEVEQVHWEEHNQCLRVVILLVILMHPEKNYWQCSCFLKFSAGASTGSQMLHLAASTRLPYGKIRPHGACAFSSLHEDTFSLFLEQFLSSPS